MSVNPPTRFSDPSRRTAPGRSLRVAAAAALILAAGCGSNTPGPAPSLATPAAVPSAARPGLDGLLVAGGGALQVSNTTGTLELFDGPRDPVQVVSAAAGHVVVVDGGAAVRHAAEPAAGARTWQRLALPGHLPDRPVVALSPTGGSLVLANGDPQVRPFDLVFVDIPSGASRSVQIDHELNGVPVWLGAGTVAINAIGPDQKAGFVVLDLATNATKNVPSFGSSLTASADGAIVALDESASGDVLVGARTDLEAGNVSGMARLPSPAGFAPDLVVLNGDGTRLGILRRSGSAVSIEILASVDGDWVSGRTLTIAGDAVLSIAWIR
jgi:hypothetical protein